MSVFADFDGRVVALVGNPAQGSRTSEVARLLTAELSPGLAPAPHLVELGALGAAAIAADGESVARAVSLVSSADVLVVATPVYKAGYTGLLKLFLDRLDATALDGTVAVPVVVAASAAHGALADLQLRVVLQAVGALLPVPSFIVEEHHLDHLSEYVAAWHGRFGPAVAAVAHALQSDMSHPS